MVSDSPLPYSIEVGEMFGKMTDYFWCMLVYTLNKKVSFVRCDILTWWLSGMWWCVVL